MNAANAGPAPSRSMNPRSVSALRSAAAMTARPRPIPAPAPSPSRCRATPGSMSRPASAARSRAAASSRRSPDALTRGGTIFIVPPRSSCSPIMASQGTPDPDYTRFQEGVRRQVAGSNAAEIIAAIRGDPGCGARRSMPRDAQEERVMSMTMKLEEMTPPSLLGRVRRIYAQLGCCRSASSS